MKNFKIAAVVTSLFLSVMSCTATIAVSPEMYACMSSHGSKDQYCPVIARYADEDVVQKAWGLLAIPHPYVVSSAQQGTQTVYTVEGFVSKASGEFPEGSLVTYRVAWEGNRIVSLEFVKVQKLEEVIPFFTT